MALMHRSACSRAKRRYQDNQPEAVASHLSDPGLRVAKPAGDCRDLEMFRGWFKRVSVRASMTEAKIYELVSKNVSE
jgi:hypothetical protein